MGGKNGETKNNESHNPAPKNISSNLHNSLLFAEKMLSLWSGNIKNIL